MAFEGLRLFDINRWEIGEVKAGLLQGMYYINGATGDWEILDYGQVAEFRADRDYCWPIPQDEMNINDVITQKSRLHKLKIYIMKENVSQKGTNRRSFIKKTGAATSMVLPH